MSAALAPSLPEMTPTAPRTKEKGRILVVDDEPIIREVLAALLGGSGYDARMTTTGEEALEELTREEYDAVLLDLMLPGRDGLDTMKAILSRDPDQVVIMVTAYATVETAVSAIRAGAFDYIQKPFQNDQVLLALQRGLERRQLKRENRQLRRELMDRYGLDNIVGRDPRMLAVYDLILQAAPSRSSILVYGESGTGKELVARAIHNHSSVANGPFVTVNSANLPPELLESSLFGHVKGAFTGAHAFKKGLFEAADGGTIFFDEIGNVPMETQSKLLRVVQDRQFMRLGGVDTISVNVRIISATNSDLEKAMREARFREDLYYRLNVIRIDLPPLRSRKNDIPFLASHFLKKYSEENHKPVETFDPDAMKALLSHSWPGNVRELENVVERAVVLSKRPVVTPDLLPHSVTTGAREPDTTPEQGLPLKQAVESFERRMIEETLRTVGGVQRRAAEILQVKPTTLNEMIKRYDIRPRRRRAANGQGPSGEADPGEPRRSDVAGPLSHSLEDK